MEDKPSIDPKRFSVWIVASVCIGLLGLLLGAVTFNQTQTNMLMTQGELLILNKKIEEVRKLAQGAAAPAPSSAPAQPAAEPAK